jgi:hypothetical protein
MLSAETGRDAAAISATDIRDKFGARMAEPGVGSGAAATRVSTGMFEEDMIGISQI